MSKGKADGLRAAIKAVQRYKPPTKSEWEIRYWVVKETLVRRLKRAIQRLG